MLCACVFVHVYLCMCICASVCLFRSHPTGASTRYGDHPNTHVAVFDIAEPGMCGCVGVDVCEGVGV